MADYHGAGSIVEFMQDNSPQIGWVMEEQNSKLRLLLPNRRELPLPASRLLPWSGPQYGAAKSKEEVVQILNTHKERRQKLEAEIDALELWSMVQGEVEREQAAFFAELITGEPDADGIAACAHALLNLKSYFRFQPPEFEVYDEATVQQKQEAEAAAREREALVGGGAEWFRLLWESRVSSKPAPSANLCPVEPVRGRLERMLRARISDPETQEDDHLWKQVTKSLPDDPMLPLLLAMSWGLVPAHYNYWLDRADYAAGHDWEQEFAAETEALITRCTQEAGVQAESTERFISIDSASTRDIDDAFAIAPREEGGWNVSVALACPARFWQFQSSLDKAVFHRSTSLYLPEATYHMMPEVLGTQCFSLLAGELRPSLVFHCEVAADGILLSSSAAVEWVRLVHNLDYDSCEEVLRKRLPVVQEAPEVFFASEADGEEDAPDCAEASESALEFGNGASAAVSGSSADSADAAGTPTEADAAASDARLSAATEFGDYLECGHAFAEARLALRVAQGAVIIDREEPEFRLEGELPDVTVRLVPPHHTPMAQLLVSELMILANAALADFAIKNNFPLLFRTQDVAVPKEFSGVWTKPQDIARVVRVMTAASTESSPRPHAGMGLHAYSPVTSPLRRYSDLVNEAQLIAFLQNGQPRWDREALDALLFNLHIFNDAAAQVQRYRPRYWRLVYLQQEARRQGERCGFRAIISDENDMYVTACLTETQFSLRGKRTLFGGKAMLGQPVLLRLGKINPLRGEISILAVQEAE